MKCTVAVGAQWACPRAKPPREARSGIRATRNLSPRLAATAAVAAATTAGAEAAAAPKTGQVEGGDHGERKKD